jgi:RNA polymerase sigma-70 factor (ECF subfamily)
MFVMGLPAVSRPLDPDAPLIGLSRAGDAEAFGRLVARYRDGVYSFVRHVVGDEADAQDLAQETFVRAYAALDRFRPGAPFEPWIYAIAANLCRSHLRRARKRPLSLDAEGTGALAGPADWDPAVTAEQREQTRRVRDAIQALPVDQRLVIVLRHLHGRSYTEIAAVLKLPVSTVEHRLRAARKVLRTRLFEEGVSAPEGGR